jgi:GNAT superfamily N-acetyltransferase
MNHMSAVRPFQAGDVPAVTAIVRGLPDYFTEDVPDKVEHDAASHQAWAITDSGTVAGFAIAARKSPAGAEILWIAVDAARRGRGHGTRLLGRVLDHLGADGISVVEAKTLDRSSGYRPLRGHPGLLGTQRLRPRRHDRPAARLGARQPGGNLRSRTPPNPLTGAGRLICRVCLR